MKIRDNIADYIVTCEDGTDVLLPQPIVWEDGEMYRIATEHCKGIDIKALCAMLVEDQESDLSVVTYQDVYEICETLLQMHEDGFASYNLYDWTPEENMDFCINTISGRYPEKGYCTNEKCKEICYVLGGNGTINKKEEKIEFNQGDVILID